MFGGSGGMLLFLSLGLATEVRLVSASSFAVDNWERNRNDLCFPEDDNCLSVF